MRGSMICDGDESCKYDVCQQECREVTGKKIFFLAIARFIHFGP